jgi:hypothetical protein
VRRLESAVALAVAVLSLVASPASADGPWQTDLERARAQAREEGRPLLVVFR